MIVREKNTMRILRSFGMVVCLMSSGIFAATPVVPPSTEPFGPERLLILRSQNEQAIKAFEGRAQRGECRGAVCEANLAIAFSRMKQVDHALEQARMAVDHIEDEPPLTAWEANEIGAILFRAPKRDGKDLTLAVQAFRFARKHYSGRASNIAFNLAQALQESGKSAEALAIQRELEAGMLVDPKFAILGDFQGVGVEQR